MPKPRRIRFVSTPGAVISSTVYDDPARVYRLDQVDTPEQRGLARARRADQAYHLVRGDRQVYAFQNLVLPEGFVEVFQDEGGTLVHARAPLLGGVCRGRSDGP